MTALLRTRGSAPEMARLFGAASNPGLDWRESIWIGDRVPVVWIEGGGRRLATCNWALLETAFALPVPAKQRGTLYPRDLVPAASRLCNPAGLRRCLIIVESFAYPDGAKGQRTRCWFGLRDNPLIVWAGLCSADGENCVGILVQANDRIEPYSETMPRLLLPEDRERWLAGEGLLSLGPTIDANAFYRENLGERWSTGRPDENEAATSLRAAG